MSKINTLDFIINKANKIHNNSYDYSLLKEHKSMHDKVDIICPKHGIFTKSMHSHLHKKRGCKYCAIERVTDTKEIFIEKANKIHDYFYNYDEVVYINSRTKIIIRCPIHGKFSQLPRDHINSKQGCPICSESKGEKKIRIILKSLNISYESEKKFCDLKHKNYLSFDFYLPEYNICIEFDGEKHFDSYDIFGGEKSFNVIKIRDNLKNDYCGKNNIRLLRISYKDINIENLITNFLKK